MTQAENNPYNWDPSSEDVASEVVSIEVGNILGEKLPTENLTVPALISMPHPGNHSVTNTNH